MNLSVPVLREVAAVVRERLSGCAEAGWDIKWIAPPNLHIVLHHLGEISLALPEAIRETLIHSIEQTSPIELGARGFTPVTINDEVQVIAARIEGELSKLAELRERVEEKISEMGFKPEPWPEEPLVTLGRVRTKGEKPLEELLAEVADWDFGLGLSAELVLYRSDVVTPKGEFARLWHLHLGGAPREEDVPLSPSPSPRPSEEAGPATPEPS